MGKRGVKLTEDQQQKNDAILFRLQEERDRLAEETREMQEQTRRKPVRKRKKPETTAVEESAE
jgi:hypothetical protein